MIEKLERKEKDRMSPFTKCLLDLEIKYKKEGIKEGIKKGIKQAVENMLKFGEPEDKIMKCMGISKEELDNIKSTI